MESEGPDEGLDLSPFRGEAEEEDVSTEEEEENPNLLPPIHLYNKAFVEPYIVKLDVDAVVKYWLERVENNGLNEEGMLDLLKEYWVKIVPWCFRLELNQSCLHPFKRTALEVDCFLIQPLALFLSGGEKGEKDIVEYLVGLDQPATVCGKVFQMGEATYSCRQCGMDPTCVLCADCFKTSDHRHHKYKIATSMGGGYCDCGDPEAWKSSVHCETHKPKIPAAGARKSWELEAFEKRARLMLPAVLLYCFELTANELESHLPASLNIEVDKELQKQYSACHNLFCTVLYNDEVHTFDTVINTLTKALNCTKKEAVEFATMVDREGRAIVRVSWFTPCHEAQKIIEKNTGRGSNAKPLKCAVVKKEVVQHQAHALKLLQWLEVLCTHSLSIRRILQNVFYCRGDGLVLCAESTRNTWLVDAVLLNDTKLWKFARSCWHRLIIAGLLKEYDSKKTFAEVFTREYVSIMDDFIQDDHDHSFSVTSLSVQIFTVPSIAHILVEDHDVIYTILRVLLAQCDSRVNSNGKLEFDRGAVVAAATFKRTNFAILDLKYILTNPPTEWSALMVKNYTHGIDSFLKFLSYMQEMDAVTRQVGQHMEFEAEWESAFNLHIKLQPVVQLSLEWCSLNKPVFVRAFRHCLHDLSKAYESLKSKTVTLELANHSATCYGYDVATQPVSVHLPLTRYFAGLYLHLKKFDLDFFSSEFNLLQTEKPVPEMIMEPALRVQVLIAQVSAGLWKRNGYSLLNQLFFYHNVRCRSDMLDKDIITLQIAASIIESNEFLIHVINRFGLHHWILNSFDDKILKTDDQDEDFCRFLGTILEEFFRLLTTIVSARYTPGVGEVTRAQAVKKEVIQQLCIEPMTHSMLNKALVENVNLETGLEVVVRDVANIKDPTPQRTSVVYELKPELYDDYDIYHYHYSREDMSKAEENQRARKRAAKEPEIFPPPNLPPFSPMFEMVVNMLQCDVFLHVINLVLKKNLERKACQSFKESLISKVLHLIGIGLNEELARNQQEVGHFFQFSQNASRWTIFELLDTMLHESEFSQHHAMIVWLKKRLSAIKPETTEAEDLVVSNPDEEEEKRRKAEMVRQAKEKMMANMAAAQAKFMMVNKDLFLEDAEVEQEDVVSADADAEMAVVETVALGPHQQGTPQLQEEKLICILCQEEENLSVAPGSKRFVLACFLQRSTIMSQYRDKFISDQSPTNLNYCESVHLTSSELENPLYLNTNLNQTNVMTTCGHIMHDHCFSAHLETVVSKERRRPYRLRNPISFDVDKMEWMCPMCDTICNAVLPMALHASKMFNLVPTSQSGPRVEKTGSDSFDLWMQGLQLVLQSKEKYGALSAPEVYATWCRDKWGSGEENLTYELQSKPLPDILSGMLGDDQLHFSQLYPLRHSTEAQPTCKWLSTGFHQSFQNFMTRAMTTGLGIELKVDTDFRRTLCALNTLSFTIISAEAFHRDQNVSFFGENVPLRRWIGIKYLIRACSVLCDNRKLQEDLRTFAIRLLSTLLSNKQSDPNIYEPDAFGILVTLTFCMPGLFAYESAEQDTNTTGAWLRPPIGTQLDHHILRLCYMFHVTQILLCNDFSHCLKDASEDGVAAGTSGNVAEAEPMETDTETPGTSSGFVTRKEYIFGRIWERAKKSGVPFSEMSKVDCDAVWKCVQNSSIPFLRCCAKLYESLTGISPSPKLQEVSTSFDDLMKYLDLPKEFEDLFATPAQWQIPYKWASHPRAALTVDKSTITNTLKGGAPVVLPETVFVHYPRNLPPLYDLPEDYAELINMVSNFTCKHAKSMDSRTPTICLICGTILCSQSYCCQRELRSGVIVGACMFHAAFCGGGTGLFLRIRECKLFMTFGYNRGYFVPPPYLDEYGEPDQGLRRGNPLKLSRDKYDVIRKMWIQHAIPEEIARVTAHNVNLAATEWQYL